VRARSAEYAQKCADCRRHKLGPDVDIEDAVASCANDSCETWVDRHWAKRKMRRVGPERERGDERTS
jgi:hypothetical protein